MNNINGILNILKPPNMTSHDIVSLVRKKLKVKKVGHTGTLDPMAAGVLPICIGKATKIVEYLQKDTKVYRAELSLGIVTDTQDRWGNILSENTVDILEDDIVNTINSFRGEIEQTPPMYSAIKHKGKKLYELAREGITIKRDTRKVIIYSIDIVNIKNNKVLFDVKCSKGTYIRTLCHDIGQSLGCGGHMSFLIRKASGVFKLKDSITIEELNRLEIDEIKSSYLLGIDYPLNHIPSVDVDPSALKYVLNGVPLRAHNYKIRSENIKDNDIVRLYTNHKFIALGLYENLGNRSIIKVKKLLS